jgi:phosphoribosylamine---glycine ligase
MTMKILVIGQGGREHALVWKLRQSASVTKVYCAPGNAGTGADGTNVRIASDDIAGLLLFAQKNDIDLTIVGPEAPLVAGLTDKFRDAGLRVFGPSAAAARLEGSKVYTKKLLRRANIPTSGFAVFTRFEEAQSWLEQQEDRPFVVKADGLAAGKGVFVCRNRSEASVAAASLLRDRSLGAAGKVIVIEECLEGQEVSVLAIVDHDTIVTLPVSQDHKRAHDGDKGPNTGGMGAYCPAPAVDDAMMTDIVQHILLPTVHQMKVDDCPFTGVLYAGLMLTAHGPKVLEYNVRFGDPEAQPVLMRLKSDLAKLLSLAAEDRLSEIEDLEWDTRAAICVVMAADGYPGSYKKGAEISGIQQADAIDSVKVFHAGTTDNNGTACVSGGRVLGVTALGDSIADAQAAAYSGVECIQWKGSWYRSDIANKAISAAPTT